MIAGLIQDQAQAMRSGAARHRRRQRRACGGIGKAQAQDRSGFFHPRQMGLKPREATVAAQGFDQFDGTAGGLEETRLEQAFGIFAVGF